MKKNKPEIKDLILTVLELGWLFGPDKHDPIISELTASAVEKSIKNLLGKQKCQKVIEEIIPLHKGEKYEHPFLGIQPSDIIGPFRRQFEAE